MKEPRAVIEAYKRAMRADVSCALATVVCVEGSTYRRPGARMLMTAEGQMTGSLSGGCLERDVFERARGVMKTGASIVVRYDTGAQTDIVWGLGLGCNGVVHILIEPLAGSVPMPPHLKLLADCIEGQAPCVVATIFGVSAKRAVQSATSLDVTSFSMPADSAQIKVGSHLLLRQNEKAHVEFRHEELARLVMQDARESLERGESSVKAYELAAHVVEVFIEVVEPPLPLVVFGANADAAPILEFAQRLGWHVTIVDTQARAASRARFADADAVQLCCPEDVPTQVSLTARTMVIVMTHNYLHDVELFKTLSSSPVRYIGMLGPKRRTEQIIDAARGEGVALSEAGLRRLHAPIGLDLGAESSEEIALSIIAEIRAVLAGHSGGFLKDRTAPIHNLRVPRNRMEPLAEREPQTETLAAIGA